MSERQDLGGDENFESNFSSSIPDRLEIITNTSSGSDVVRHRIPGSQGAGLTTHSTFDPNRVPSQSSEHEYSAIHTSDAPDSIRNRSDPIGGPPMTRHVVTVDELRSAPLQAIANMIRDRVYNLFFPDEPDHDSQIAPTSFGYSDSDSAAYTPRPESRGSSYGQGHAHSLQAVDFEGCNLGSAYDAFAEAVRDYYSESSEGDRSAPLPESQPSTTVGETRESISEPGNPWWQNIPNYAPEIILRDEHARARFINYLLNVQSQSAPNDTHRQSPSNDRRTKSE